MKQVTIVTDYETDKEVYDRAVAPIINNAHVFSFEITEVPTGPKHVFVLTCDNEDAFPQTTIYGTEELAQKVFEYEVQEIINTHTPGNFNTPKELLELIETEAPSGGEYYDDNGLVWSYTPWNGTQGSFSVYEDGEYNNFHADVWLEKQEEQ